METLRQAVHHPRAETAAYAVSIALLIVSLLVPPFSAANRLLHYDYPLIAKGGGVVSAADGAQLLIPDGALASSLRLKMTAMSVADFLSGNRDKTVDMAAQALSMEPVTLLGNLYRFLVHGSLPSQALLSVPLQNARLSLVDVFSWDGEQWQWQPTRAIPEDGLLEARLDTVPSMAVLAEVKAHGPEIGTVLTGLAQLPDQALGLVSEAYLDGFQVNGTGAITDLRGGGRADDTAPYGSVAVVRNEQDGEVRPQLLSAILLDPEARATNVTALTVLAVERMYTGVQLDYQGLDPKLREEFVTFVSEVADSLHREGKLLAVSVAPPTQVAEDRWDTGAYDWRGLGEVADVVVVPAIEQPQAYAPDGQMEALLRWAVGEVNRTKLQINLSVFSYQVVDQSVRRIAYREALAELGQLVVEDSRQLVSPGDAVSLKLASLVDAGGIQYDPQTATYWVAYRDDQGSERQIWLENATSLARKLRLVLDFNVRGVILENLVDDRADPRDWDLLQHFKELYVPAVDSDFTVVWTVRGPTGEEVRALAPLSDGSTGVESPALAAPQSPSPGGPSYIWQVPDNPGDYLIEAEISDDGGLTSQVRSNAVSLQVPTPTPTPTPTPIPTPTPTPEPTPTPTAKPKPAPAVSTRGPGFSFGIQGDAITDGDHGRLFGHIQQLGFSWFKQQVEWFRYNPAPGQYDWGALDRIVDSASAAGIKVLFSVVKAPHWARPPQDTDEGPPSDPNTYGEFLRAMAAHYKGRVQAYEIWNEQNLYYEWGGLGNKLNAARYVELLKVAYQAIKSVDPGAVVISGALTPTGYNDGNIAIDDRVYLEQMYQAGMKDYCDAVGAHPSGYNNPPDADWQTYQDPSASFNAKGHPSWFFRGTMESYRNIMVKYGDGAKRVWPTEFGWASVESLGAPPAGGYEYSADNTEAEQAQFIVRAYEIAKGWGWVGPMFLWNLNFGPICGCGDEKSAFGIVRPDWGLRPAFAALAQMPK